MHPAQLDYTALIPLLEPLEQAPRWRIAWSGGLDSSVLLHLLTIYRSRRRRTPPLLALHVNHQLQAAADDWAEHCAQLAQALAVPLRTCRVEVSLSGAGLEADARHARYTALAAGLAPGEVVMLAHHRDDQSETVLLRLLRGSGLAGLQGMPARRALGRGELLRPLLAWPRSALEDYARRHRLRWIDDPSNLDGRHDRNFLRQQVLPLLDSRWPDAGSALVRAAEHLRDAGEALDALLPALQDSRSALGDPGVVLAALLQESDAVALLQLRRWLRETGLPAPQASTLREFLRQLRAGGGQAACMRFGDWMLQRFGPALYLLPATLPSLEAGRTVAPGQHLSLATGSLTLLPATTGAGLRLQAGERLQIRSRSGGERLRLPGRAGHRSLKKLLNEAGIPPWWRERLPLLYLEDELVAVAGMWLCDSSRLQPAGGADCWRPEWRPHIQQPAPAYRHSPD